MTKPKPKDNKPTLPVKPKAKAPATEDLEVGPNVLLAPPSFLYAIVDDDGYEPPYTLTPVVALFHDSNQNRIIGYVPVGSEILPVTEVDSFVQYWAGDPDDFDAKALGLTDEDDDASDDEDDEAKEDEKDDEDDDDD